MVLVFKTSVQTKANVRRLKPLLDELVVERGRWNFDLEDCDRIFRLESEGISSHRVISFFKEQGLECQELT
ncbi:hypothetical protein GCM10027275_51070 [Rhabdobacter roseus]|uniref:Uncharacterized protein n=1 Tax=Rhabdobacter roseus TaxID=1655419 RepID=A0A840TTA0_9BACT|nr:hypothetical protein [Rhabdobacter roseus]MBB5287181.1 hypothetical protein [Rhabdobacter roseus]